MLYKHLFSILCGHLNLNQKRKKNWIWPVISQTDRLPVKPAGKPVGTDWTCDFEFDRFPPVSGQTGLVNRYRRATIWPDRSGLLTLLEGRRVLCFFTMLFLSNYFFCHSGQANRCNAEKQDFLSYLFNHGSKQIIGVARRTGEDMRTGFVLSVVRGEMEMCRHCCCSSRRPGAGGSRLGVYFCKIQNFKSIISNENFSA